MKKQRAEYISSLIKPMVQKNVECILHNSDNTIVSLRAFSVTDASSFLKTYNISPCDIEDVVISMFNYCLSKVNGYFYYANLYEEFDLEHDWLRYTYFYSKKKLLNDVKDRMMITLIDNRELSRLYDDYWD